MKNKNFIKSAFSLFQQLHHHNNYPKLYWILYFLAILNTFLNLSQNQKWVLFNNAINIFSLPRLLNDSVNFAICIFTSTLHLITLLIVLSLKNAERLTKSNLSQMVLKLLFYLTLFNFTYGMDFACNIKQNSYRVAGIFIYTVGYIISIGIMNFSFNSKRIWQVNQLFVLDILRLVLLWTNGSKILILICLFLYLMISALVIILRPIFHNSSHNYISNILVSLSLSLAMISISKSLMQQLISDENTIYTIGLICLFTGFFYYTIQKWLDYLILNLNKTDKQDKNNTINKIILLQYLQKNVVQYQNQIILYMINHSKSCNISRKCPYKQIINIYYYRNGQDQQKSSTSNHTNTINSNTSSNFQHKKITKKNEKIKKLTYLFSQFILLTINQYQHNYLHPNLNHKNQQTFKNGQTKQLSQSQKRHFYQQNIILCYLRVQKLINDVNNLNSAYLNIKSLQSKLQHYQAYGYHCQGILMHFQSQIVQRKSISLQSSIKSNKFCINYYHFQKIFNHLEQYILNAVNQLKNFWQQIIIKQPDNQKILSIMARFNKYYKRVINLHTIIKNDPQKQTNQVLNLFKFFENVLEISNNYKFFKENIPIQNKFNQLKNAVSMDLKLYSDESNTQMLNFSIDKCNFGQIIYKSSKFVSLIDNSYKNINQFLPKQCHKIHQKQIKNFLQMDNNYYKHTQITPCYIQIKDNIIKPIYLQTHLITFLQISEISIIAFLKPLIQDSGLLKVGTCKNFQNKIEQQMVALMNNQGEIVSYTKTFQSQKVKMFQNIEIQNIFNRDLFSKLQNDEIIHIQLSDSDYQISLIKKISSQNHDSTNNNNGKFLYYVRFLNHLQKNIGSNQDQQVKQKQQQVVIQYRKKKLNIKNLFIKTLDQELDQVQKYDEKLEKLNKIYSIAISTDQQGLIKYWRKIMLAFFFTFIIFVVVITINLILKQTFFIQLHDFLCHFTSLQNSIVQSIMYLRQVNLNVWNSVNLNQIPVILEQVERLNDVMYDNWQSLTPYLNINFPSMDILSYGPRILRQQKGYIVINNYILNTITNILENVKTNINQLKFSPIQSQVRVPYTQTQQSFLKLVSNGVSFVIPSCLLLRQKTLKNTFLPNLNNTSTQAVFYVPIIGLLVGLSFIAYQFYLKIKIKNITLSTLNILNKLKVQFANSKLQNIIKQCNKLRKKQIKRRTSLNNFNKPIFKNFTDLFEKTSTLAFGTFVFDTGNQPQKPVTIQNQQTQRQLKKNNSSVQSSIQNLQKSSDLDINNKQKNSDCVDQKSLRQQNDKLQFNVSINLIESKWQKIAILLPVIFITGYYLHIFLFSHQFNSYIKSTLLLQNQLYYQKQSIGYTRYYNYQLGLFQSFNPFAAYILQGYDSTYKSIKQLQVERQQTQNHLFGKLQNFNSANQILKHGNICNNLNLLERVQPSFSVNFTKQQCQNLNEKILTNGYKAAQVQLIQTSRMLTLQNMNPQYMTPAMRYSYLNDSKIKKVDQIYPYLNQIFTYLNKQFNVDFLFFIRSYQLFVIFNAPVIIILSIVLMIYYLRYRQKQIQKNIAMIKCTFLLIGHKAFLNDKTLLIDEITGKDGDQYLLLE